jgi:hypothetical protein
MREIEAHGGFSSQNPIDPHFGLGGAASIDVRIRWPGSAGRRIIQDILGVAAGQLLVVEEAGAPAAVAAPIDETLDHGQLHVFPNPSHGRTRIEPAAGSAPFTTVTILDVAGREVWSSRADANSRTVVTWDGSSKEGRRAPAGVYFARGVTIERSAIAPFLLLP